MSLLMLDVGATAAAGLLLVFLLGLGLRKTQHLPPGPRGLPLLGNVLQIPRRLPHVAFRDMGHKCGDIVALRVPGYNLLVLNSRQAIYDLLDSRSAVYSDRPQGTMSRLLIGLDGAVALSNNTARFRSCRKLLRKGLGASAVQSFIPFLNRQSALYLENLQSRPEAFVEITKRNAAAISMKIAYGYDGIADDEELYRLAHQTTIYFAETAVLGAWPVDMFPILRFIPSWFPLAYFRRYAARARPVVVECINKPFEETKRHMRLGSTGASFTSMLLGDANGDPDTEDYIKWSSAAIFLGQMDTTTAVLSWFYLAMALHPEVQAKAQAEIDQVVGNERLPRIEDRDSLPHVCAVMREVFRWHPVANLVPHATNKDDHYRDYFIPAQTVAIANVWAVLHDENVYHDADKFIPERFSEEGAPDSLEIAFGFGRRACPGKIVGQAHVFASIATVLATFNVTKARDAQGNVIEPEVVDTPGAVNTPQPFKVNIEPRSEAAADLIRRSAEHSKTLPERLEIFSLDA
uniref:Cytochrome P450 n=1 Tax=Phanerodontia chrysosporium TaxID=2822231 RepID=G5EJT4_PHACH|nr:cytochrome P450 [Phanerodontia chrysosporium]